MLVKGIKEGVLIKLDPGNCRQQRDILMNHVREQEKFYFGSKIGIDVGETEWEVSDINALIKDLNQHQVELVAFLCESSRTKELSKSLSIANHMPLADLNKNEKYQVEESLTKSAAFLNYLPRNMKNLKYEGDVTIIGDIPKGITVEATGNILVWGKIDGTVKAGCGGDKNMAIYGLVLSSKDIFISGIKLEKIPEFSRRGKIIFLDKEGNIKIRTWKPGK